MRLASDAENFFQTDAALSESARKAAKAHNNAGQPVRLSSKLLAVAADPFDSGAVYVAEAAGTIKRVDLEAATVFGGCWDKCVYAWPVESKFPAQSRAIGVLKQHSDFVKALLVVPPACQEKDALLISGSADKTIVVWNATTFEKFHILIGHSRGVQALALDPLRLLDQTGFIFSSGDSNREIRFWQVSHHAAHQVSARHAAVQDSDEHVDDINMSDSQLVAHETSIYALQYSDDGDLWTASADKNVKRLSRARGFEIDTVLSHSDHVKALAVNEGIGLVVTAGRNENLDIWSSVTGAKIASLMGHWEEITGLALICGGSRLVSVSIDGTIRSWSLAISDIAAQVKRYHESAAHMKTTGPTLTDLEEQELADLMDSE